MLRPNASCSRHLRRKRNHHAGALAAGRRAQVDARAVALRDLVDDREAEAAALRRVLVQPVEALEDPLALVDRNAGTVVAYLEDRPLRLGARGDADHARAVARRVVDDVRGELAQQERIA